MSTDELQQSHDMQSAAAGSNHLTHFSPTILALGKFSRGEVGLRKMCEHWCHKQVEDVATMSKQQVIEALNATAATAGRRLGKMQHDAQRRIHVLKENCE